MNNVIKLIHLGKMKMRKLLNHRKRFAPHTKVEYNTGRVKDGRVKTLSIAFSNIIHYGSSFYRRLDRTRNGNPSQRLSNHSRCLLSENENNNYGT